MPDIRPSRPPGAAVTCPQCGGDGWTSGEDFLLAICTECLGEKFVREVGAGNALLDVLAASEDCHQLRRLLDDHAGACEQRGMQYRRSGLTTYADHFGVEAAAYRLVSAALVAVLARRPGPTAPAPAGYYTRRRPPLFVRLWRFLRRRRAA